MNSIELSNGMRLPRIGLGAKGIWGGEDVLNSELAQKQYDIYKYALESKQCELFDTSESYGYNERLLGEAIKETKSRNRVQIISKISNRSQKSGNVRAALEKSLKTLNTDYLDVYLIHWPQTGCFVDTYLQMEQLYKEGLVRAIGVCNCNIHHLNEIMYKATIPPMINQIEVHPMFTQEALVNFCYAMDIKVIAYSPVARMHDVLIKSRPIYELSRNYAKSPVQIILRWHYQNERIAIPQTTSREHFKEIFEIFDFELTRKEMAWINSLNENMRMRYNPDNCDFSRLG